MTQLGIKCPFCGHPLSMDSFQMFKGRAYRHIVFCDNDQCSINPCSADTNASRVFEDVAAWGAPGQRTIMPGAMLAASD